MAKKAKKSAKKKSVKKAARKAAKKGKKSTKVKKKAAKKATKQSARKATKKTTKKIVAKGASKKAVTKSSAKKSTKKAVKASASNPAATVQGLKEGDLVPNLRLAATGGKEISLSDLKGKKVVLFFYPKDMTPGCTIEGRDFSTLKNEFEQNNAVVLGISRDTIASHEKFIAKENYTVDLLADTEEAACNAFGVIKDKNMYGKMVRGIDRSTFLIDESGTIAKVWRGVKVDGHAQEVLQAVKS